MHLPSYYDTIMTTNYNTLSIFRCYYRCTHKDDQGCQATKQVQQKDNEDPPKYVVTYNKQHTCKKIDLLLSEEFVIEGGKFVIEPPPPITDPCQLSL